MPAPKSLHPTEVPSGSSDRKMTACVRSRFPDPELKLLPCNCHFHSNCFPLSSIMDENKQYAKGSACPNCGETIKGIYLFPMDINRVKQQMLSDRPNMVERESGKVNERFEEDFYVTIAPIFLVTPTGGVSVAEEAQIRNGRWTKEEVDYVDYLMKLFTDGALPLPDGITLNDFLRSIFLCKSTRLRKKIKSANFCTRTYSSNVSNEASLETCRELSKRQADFLRSLETKSDQQLLKFSISRIWTMHFFNYCVQHECEIVSARDWLESLEMIENQVTASKEAKKQRERRLKVDAIAKMTAKPSDKPSFYQPSLVNKALNSHSLAGLVPQSLEVSNDTLSLSDLSDTFISQEHASSLFMKEHFNDVKRHETEEINDIINTKRAKFEDEVFSKGTVEICDDEDDFCRQFGDWSPFISKINSFLQKEGLPFEYFDIWLASDSNQIKHDKDHLPEELSSLIEKKTEGIVLRHVGHATRSNTDSILTLYHMNEFGKYSSKFNFPPGVGLPGRVLKSGVPLWDDAIEKSSLNHFPRREMAKAHGVRKALGIPMFNFPMGKVVVALYCSENVPGDFSLLQKCCMKLQGVELLPKWDICVDTGEVPETLKLTGPTLDESEPPSNEECQEDTLLIDLLGKFAPLDCDSKPGLPDMYESYSSLRLLLLKRMSTRSSDENGVLKLLKQSYKNYLVSGRKENEIASFLVQEWMVLRTSLKSHPQQVDETFLFFQPNLVSHQKYSQDEMSC